LNELLESSKVMNFERKQFTVIYDHDIRATNTRRYTTICKQVAAHITSRCKKDLVNSHTIYSRISNGSEIRGISCLIKWLYGKWYSKDTTV